jgi:hypothetical protein
MKIILNAFLILAVAAAASPVSAFLPNQCQSTNRCITRQSYETHPSPLAFTNTAKLASIDTRKNTFTSTSIRSKAKASDSNGNNDNETNPLTINPTYAIPYAIFLAVATYMSIHEPDGASQAIIEKFIADPLHPNLGSSLFEVVFNTLGLVGLPMACLIMPGAKGQKFNPTPFLFGSAAAGYGSIGLFMMTRTPNLDTSTNELGWFTKNVLENKIFNWLLVAALANTYLITGAGEGLIADAGAVFGDFGNFISQSALGFVSTVDLTILCLTGASLVPEDLERRGMLVGDEDKGKAYAIAASTLLVPALGLALYSALRPPLDSDN